MSIGKAYERLEELDSAAKHMAEALRIFKCTVGDDSPLTAHAIGSLGKVRAVQGPARQREALALLKGALTLEVSKDAFYLETARELLTRLKDLHMEEAKEQCCNLVPIRMLIWTHNLQHTGSAVIATAYSNSKSQFESSFLNVLLLLHFLAHNRIYFQILAASIRANTANTGV